jgi:hypothetical protein
MGILCHFFLVYNVGLGPLALVVSTSFIGFFSYIILLLTFGTKSQIIQVFDYFRLAFDKGKI